MKQQPLSAVNEVGAHRIRDSIRDAIVERRLAPGTKLSETEVGSLFSVSRTLARAALQALSFEGLVSVERNRGAFVAYPSPTEAKQIFAARRLVEPGIVRTAAEVMEPADFARLRQLLMEEGRLMEVENQNARHAEIQASGDFHLALSRIAGNVVMHRFMEELVARSSLVIALYGRSSVSSCGHDEHGAILEALQSRNVEVACRAMLDHIAHIEADLDLHEKRGLSLKEAFAI